MMKKNIYGTHLQHKLNEINKIKTMKMKGKRMWNAVIQHTPSQFIIDIFFCYSYRYIYTVVEFDEIFHRIERFQSEHIQIEVWCSSKKRDTNISKNKTKENREEKKTNIKSEYTIKTDKYLFHLLVKCPSKRALERHAEAKLMKIPCVCVFSHDLWFIEWKRREKNSNLKTTLK